MTLYGVSIDGERVELQSVEVERETKLYYFVNRRMAITGYSKRVPKHAVMGAYTPVALTPEEAWAKAKTRTKSNLERAQATLDICRAQHERISTMGQEA